MSKGFEDKAWQYIEKAQFKHGLQPRSTNIGALLSDMGRTEDAKLVHLGLSIPGHI